MPHKFSLSLRQIVRERAASLCEYCHASEKWQVVEFSVGHIDPEGSNDLENLALACCHCNRYKSNKTTVISISIGREIPLFDPRTMNWADHFIWSEDHLSILPMSEIGQSTIEILRFNRPRIISIRYDDVLIDRHPPKGDPIRKR